MSLIFDLKMMWQAQEIHVILHTQSITFATSAHTIHYLHTQSKKSTESPSSPSSASSSPHSISGNINLEAAIPTNLRANFYIILTSHLHGTTNSPSLSPQVEENKEPKNHRTQKPTKKKPIKHHRPTERVQCCRGRRRRSRIHLPPPSSSSTISAADVLFISNKFSGAGFAFSHYNCGENPVIEGLDVHISFIGLNNNDGLPLERESPLDLIRETILPSVMVELRAGMKVCRIFACTGEIRRKCRVETAEGWHLMEEEME